MHDAERVLKSGMHRAWIHLVCPGELSDAAEPLIGWLRDDLAFPIVERDEAMNRAADFVNSMGIQIGSPDYLKKHITANRRRTGALSSGILRP